MYQLHHKKFKTALNDYFVNITEIHSYNTRTKGNLVYFKPCVQTSAGEKSLTYREIELWRKIEPDVKQLSWLSFKKKIKQKAIQNYILYHFDLLCSIFANLSLNSVTLCINFLAIIPVKQNYCLFLFNLMVFLL